MRFLRTIREAQQTPAQSTSRDSSAGACWYCAHGKRTCDIGSVPAVDEWSNYNRTAVFFDANEREWRRACRHRRRASNLIRSNSG